MILLYNLDTPARTQTQQTKFLDSPLQPVFTKARTWKSENKKKCESFFHFYIFACLSIAFISIYLLVYLLHSFIFESLHSMPEPNLSKRAKHISTILDHW